MKGSFAIFALGLASIEWCGFLSLLHKHGIGLFDRFDDETGPDWFERFLFSGSFADFLEARARICGFVFALNLAGILAWVP